MRRVVSVILVWAVASVWVGASPGHVCVSPEDFATVITGLDRDLPDTIYFRGGTYRVEEPLRISGAKDVVLAAYPGETPVFCGSVPVGGWKQLSQVRAKLPRYIRKIIAKLPAEARKHLLCTNLAEQGITDFGDPVKERKRPQLYFNGEEQTLARYPNEGFIITGRALGETVIPPVENGNSGTVEGVFEYIDPHVDGWVGEKAPWASGYWFFDWNDACRPIGEIDTARRIMTMADGKNFRHGLRFFGFNLLCEIDSPGEWYLDRDSGWLIWYPAEGVAFGSGRFSILGARFMLTLSDCRNVTVRGLSFCESRGGALKVEGGNDVRILDCRFENLGSAALRVEGGERHLIDGCVLRHLSTSGVTMTGGDRATLKPAGHVCSNTLIEDYERFNRTYHGAFTAKGCGITIRNCVMRDAPSSAMSLEGNDLVAEYNLIERVAHESDDQGGFDLYLNPSMRGIVLRYNHWKDIRGGTRYGVAGIRLDDLISGVQIYGNVFERCGSIEFGGVQVHGGSDNVIEDNLFYDCPYAVSFTPYGDSLWHATWERIREDVYAEVDMDSPEFLLRYPEARDWGRHIDVNVVRSNLLVDCGALFFRDTTPQISAGNVQLPSEGRGVAHFCSPEVLNPLGIREIPLERMGIISNKWLNDE